METFGSRLKFARGKLSQAALAARLGIPQTTLSNYEKGRNEPNFATLAQICFELHINVAWLLYGSGPMVRDSDPDRTVPPAEDSAYTVARIKELEKQLAEAREAEREALKQANAAYQKLVEVLHPESSAVSEPGVSGQKRQNQTSETHKWHEP